MASFLRKQKLPKQNIFFLGHLFVGRHPTGHFILVLDNASIHKSAASLAALSLFEHRVLTYLVPPPLKN
jgi:hypothetical protein